MDRTPPQANGKATNGAIRNCHSSTPHNISAISARANEILESGLLSNFGKYNSLLEDRLQKFLKVTHALTVPNASTGLHILLSTIDKEEEGAEVLAPSFTFAATVHPIVHAGLKPVFVDVDINSFNASCNDIIAKINSDTCAILAVNNFGNPCAIDQLERIAQQYKIRLLFDSATALGSKYQERYVGNFGDAEVFSFSGTKIVTAGEGGVITTNNDELAETIRCLRNYGYTPGKRDCLYPGFNGKLDELSAMLGLWSLEQIERQIAWRRKLTLIYKNELDGIPGLHFQTILPSSEYNHSYVAIALNPYQFHVSANELAYALRQEGIEAIRYFAPPMHRTTAYREFSVTSLKESEILSHRILCLPIHIMLKERQVRDICSKIIAIRRRALKRRNIQMPQHHGVNNLPTTPEEPVTA